MKKKAILFLVLCLPLVASSQKPNGPDIWEQFRFLEGTWEVTGDGMSGVSSVVQKYHFVLNGQFLRMTTKSIFKPQEKNPEGEIHEDFGIFSYDRSREIFVLRSFNIEGFVNQYVFNPDSGDGNILNFVSENIENAPPGTQAKLVFNKIGKDKIEQSFFVAFPGQKFSCFSTNSLQKKKGEQKKK